MGDLENNVNLEKNAQLWLDRLVDGELNADQQRQLLLAMEAQPEVWRRCALTFIESQSLHGDFRQLTEHAALTKGSQTASVATIQPARRSNGIAHRLAWLALAACALLAFTLGIVARSWWTGGLTNAHSNNIAVTQPTHPTSASKNELVAGAENPVSQETAAANNTGATSSNTAASSKWQSLKVTIPTADGQGEQSMEVPLVAASEETAQSLLSKQEPVLSDTALETLESSGHEVAQHRTYYPVQLEDGTKVVLPMDYVEVRDTGNWQ